MTRFAHKNIVQSLELQFPTIVARFARISVTISQVPLKTF